MPDERKPRRGCLFHGCIASGILALVLVAAILLGLNAARKMISFYTDATPAVLPANTLTQEQVAALQQRVAAFQQAIRQQQPTPPLALTADEINALIDSEPAAKPFRGKVHFEIEGSQPKALVSIKLEELGLPLFRDRYLNGIATLSLSVRDGFLRVRAEDIRVKGKSLPSIYLSRIRRQNLAARVNDDPRLSMALEKIEKVEIKDGRLIIFARDER